jgi:hypothetical protein
MFEMSWGKGLRRLWIVGTAIWIVGFVAFGDQYFEWRFEGPVANAVWLIEYVGYPEHRSLVIEAWLYLAYWLFGPPIAALVAGTSLIWALRGFRAGR